MERGNLVGIILLLLWVSFFLVLILDEITSEVMRTERVKCIDNQNAEFEDEYCVKEIKCGVISKIFRTEHCYGGEE